ncbi:divalent metal cation transporter, partial [Roseateles sp. GG27B]
MVIEMMLVQPDWGALAGGFVPRLDGASLLVAIGIVGATVMPHNLYLHSSLVQTRRIDTGAAAKAEAIRFNVVDTV